MKQEILNQAVAEVIAAGNPYMVGAVKFFIDHKPMYIYGTQTYSAEELNEAYRKTARHDIENGYKERNVGYYDKWYRYCRADEGRAYDKGVRLAIDSGKAPAEYHIIECIA